MLLKFAGTSVALLIVALFAAGCGERAREGEGDATTRTFAVRGIVRGIDADGGTVTVEHEDIPGFMPAMTMPFRVKETSRLGQLSAGQAVAFDFVVTDDDSWITGIRPTDAADLQLAGRAAALPPSAVARLKEGDRLLDFQLIDQAGQPVTRQDYAGRHLLLTFIFTRCPVPNFCPLMSQNFSTLEDAIAADPALADRARLLSVSFDPEHDTPEVLSSYAHSFDFNPAIWTFATGTPEETARLTRAFSVLVQPEAGTISHGLATALVDDTGVIRKLWRGNAWEPEEALSELRALAGSR